MKHSCMLLSFLFIILYSSAILIAQSIHPVFTSAGSMTVPRMGHQSIVLPNHSVLLLGGHGTNFYSLSTTDLYNPASDSCIIQKMNYPHDGGAVEQLHDGRFLIAGGAADLGVAPGYATAEIYDPADSSYTPVNNMQYGHMLHCAATLTSGNVLVAGGWYNNASATNAELFSPSSGTFSSAGIINYPRANCILIPTADSGAILFSGCPIYGGTQYESVEYYQPSQNSFTVARLRLLSSESDSGWIPMLYENYSRLMETQRLQNGRYVCMASKTYGDSSMVSLFTIDPATKEIALFPSKTPLPSSKEYTYWGPIIDTANSVAYIPAVRVDANPTQVTLVAINLKDSSVAVPASDFILPAGFYLSGVKFVLLHNGKIFMTGGTSSNDYYTNFNPVQYTYLITPNYQPKTTAVHSSTNVVHGYQLNQNYPNPFNPTTTIGFRVPIRGNVRLMVYDVLGKEIATLVNEIKEAGFYEVTMDAVRLQSGIYFYRLQAGIFSSVKKFVVLK